MTSNYNIIENQFLLDNLLAKRERKQRRVLEETGSVELALAIAENMETDNEMTMRFTTKDYKPEEVTELHTKHCLFNDINECTCSIRLKNNWVREEIA